MFLDRLPLLTLPSVDDGLLGQDLLSHQPTPGPNHAPIGDGHVGGHVALALEHIPLANLERLHRAAHLEDVVRSDDQRFDRPVQHVLIGRMLLGNPVHDRGVLLDDAVLTEHDGARLGDDGRARVDHAPTGDGDVTPQIAVLADHRPGHDFDAGMGGNGDHRNVVRELMKLLTRF